MCEFVSWVEKDDKVYFLTGEQVYHTERGQELQSWSQKVEDDKCGHGAIQFYYTFGDGENRECTDFSTPANFPPEIAEAIKSGAMRGMAIALELLTASAGAEYERLKKPNWAEYNRIIKPAWAEYERARNEAFWDLFAASKNRVEAWR